MTTLKQMIVRSNAGHQHALLALMTGREWPGMNATAAEIKGAQKIYQTLRKWGCIQSSLLSGVGKKLPSHLGMRLLNALTHREADETADEILARLGGAE